MKYAYIVLYSEEAWNPKEIPCTAPKIFCHIEGARKYYLDKIVKPFLKKNDVKEYFSYDPMQAQSDEEWKDIISTFFQTATIKKIPYDESC